jgi:hypothetical protein
MQAQGQTLLHMMVYHDAEAPFLALLQRGADPNLASSVSVLAVLLTIAKKKKEEKNHVTDRGCY